MQVIDVKNLDYKAVNEALRKADKDCSIEGCCGQRFIAAGYAMHGGKMFLRGNCKDIRFPEQVTARCASDEDLAEIKEYLSEYCTDFGYSVDELLSAPFTIITPDSKNPYKQMYVAN